MFGSYDENLRFLESLLNVRIATQGTDLLVDGEPASQATVERLVGQLTLEREALKKASQWLSRPSGAKRRLFRLESLTGNSRTVNPGTSM